MASKRCCVTVCRHHLKLRSVFYTATVDVLTSESLHNAAGTSDGHPVEVSIGHCFAFTWYIMIQT